VITCSGLVRRFGDFTAVDGISFEVDKGAICAFLGPNGAGKSTTVKMLTGLLAPTAGEASVAGLDVVRDSLQLKRICGVLPEDLGLFGSLTISEHLEMAGPIYGLSKAETRSRTNDLLEALGLEKSRHVFIDDCSHGMRKKTSLALALLHNPRVLFLDEPFEGIDPVTAKVISDLLMSLAARGITVFLTAHILSIAERLATQVVMIRRGHIVLNADPSELRGTLEETYFDLVEAPRAGELKWLGSHPS
jgi:ABC-2 type transport system ATP-binding protein